MRIILKLFAAPFVLALTLLVAALSFCVSIATWAFGILSSICAICGLFDLFRGWLTGALLAGGGFYRVPFWSACRGRMAGLQAGRSQLLVKELYHRLRLWDKVSRSFAWRLYEQPPLFICRERRCSHGYHSIDTPPYQQGGNHRQIAERPV